MRPHSAKKLLGAGERLEGKKKSPAPLRIGGDSERSRHQEPDKGKKAREEALGFLKVC